MQTKYPPMIQEDHSDTLPRWRVLIADDHPEVRAGLRALLEGEYNVVGDVADGRALLEAAKRLRPDVIVMDLSMPGMGGIEAAAQLRTLVPDSKLIMLSAHADQSRAAAAFSAGVTGYIVKRDPGQLLSFIRNVVEQGKPGKHRFFSC